ncbi:metallophosphoesterase [Microbacterium sp. X-17]|uniref:metallophosphoesterase family protein n=1 Tax=Microbacterium sp. X-17 TaxID=3144404 RepID=UPI0031F581EC
MPTRLLVVSDTHVPARARALPADLLEEARRADAIIHAGDWVSATVLDELEALAPVVGVCGNNDGGDLRARLPEVARATFDGVRFAVVHETGDAKARETRMDAAYPDTDVLVFGHSHIPWDSTTPGGMRLLNPGSPTDRRRQPRGTFLSVVVDAGTVVEARLIPVEPNAR